MNARARINANTQAHHHFHEFLQSDMRLRFCNVNSFLAGSFASYRLLDSLKEKMSSRDKFPLNPKRGKSNMKKSHTFQSPGSKLSEPLASVTCTSRCTQKAWRGAFAKAPRRSCSARRAAGRSWPEPGHRAAGSAQADLWMVATSQKRAEVAIS